MPSILCHRCGINYSREVFCPACEAKSSSPASAANASSKAAAAAPAPTPYSDHGPTATVERWRSPVGLDYAKCPACSATWVPCPRDAKPLPCGPCRDSRIAALTGRARVPCPECRKVMVAAPQFGEPDPCGKCLAHIDEMIGTLDVCDRVHERLRERLGNERPTLPAPSTDSPGDRLAAKLRAELQLARPTDAEVAATHREAAEYFTALALLVALTSLRQKSRARGAEHYPEGALLDLERVIDAGTTLDETPDETPDERTPLEAVRAMAWTLLAPRRGPLAAAALVRVEALLAEIEASGR